MKKKWTATTSYFFAISALAISFSLLPAKSFAATPLVNKTVEYGTTTKFEGYFVSPKAAKKNTPGILMIHNWKGVTEETKKQADRFASLGYHVFAADIYGKGVRPTEAKDAGAQATIYKTDRKLFRERIRLGMDELIKLQGNDQIDQPMRVDPPYPQVFLELLSGIHDPSIAESCRSRECQIQQRMDGYAAPVEPTCGRSEKTTIG